MSEGHTNSISILEAVKAVEAAGLAETLAVDDMMIYDPDVISATAAANDEDMASRSAATIAEGMLAAMPTHLMSQGPRRAALEAAKNVIELAPDQRPTDFLCVVKDALTAAPTHDQPARRWFVEEALERVADHGSAPARAPS